MAIGDLHTRVLFLPLFLNVAYQQKKTAKMQGMDINYVELNHSSARTLYTAAMLLLTPNLQGLEMFNVQPCVTPLFQASNSSAIIWQHQSYDAWYSGWTKCRNDIQEENRVCVFARSKSHTR
eukprot:613851-Prymnesium_polylepis.1